MSPSVTQDHIYEAFQRPNEEEGHSMIPMRLNGSTEMKSKNYHLMDQRLTVVK